MPFSRGYIGVYRDIYIDIYIYIFLYVYVGYIGFYRDSGKENGRYYLDFGMWVVFKTR